jgi:hypothetical protein
MKKLLLTTAALLTLSIGAVSAQETKSYAPYAGSEQPRNTFHLMRIYLATNP